MRSSGFWVALAGEDAAVLSRFVDPRLSKLTSSYDADRRRQSLRLLHIRDKTPVPATMAVR